MPVERRGQAIRVMINLVNWQQEEPTGCGGGRQLSMDGTSRVTGDSHARFCERLGVRFPGPTRRRRETVVPTATKVASTPAGASGMIFGGTQLINRPPAARYSGPVEADGRPSLRHAENRGLDTGC